MIDDVTLSKDAANALWQYLKGQYIYTQTNLKIARTEFEIAGVKRELELIKDLLSLLRPVAPPI
jgi:hypothetical protein